ncbi:MAG: circularly permuted type 2 ATP-grasp protein [Fimbriimonadaceae bacterium]
MSVDQRGRSTEPMIQEQSPQSRPSLFKGYDTGGFFDEMFDGAKPRPHYAKLYKAISALAADEFQARCELADLTLVTQGITFTVYGDSQGIEKPFPVDLIPRILPAPDWRRLSRGLAQRVRALNLFLHDVYHDGKILSDNIVPRGLIVNAPSYRRSLLGVDVPNDIYIHICGTDLIRDDRGVYRVLEDNCRTPSGVSYMLENRLILMRVFPSLFRENRVQPIDDYSTLLLHNLRQLAPPGRDDPTVVLLTPGVYNAAYFEHTFLAQQMGIELVEGRDLLVDADVVYMKTTRGPQRVDVIYRRIDDDFMDPLVFRPDSALGVPGVVNAFRAGNVALANGLGTGIADDKAVYPYVPDIIKYYLDQEPLIEQVETFMAWRENDLDYICSHARDLVIKETNGSGGYGMLIGPSASTDEIARFVAKVKTDPRGFVAQPLIRLSRSPCFIDGHIEGRHVDLRPYVLCGKDDVTIVPGGLTRVALTRDSFVVNSSQGGGSKDTWVLADSTTTASASTTHASEAGSC